MNGLVAYGESSSDEEEHEVSRPDAEKISNGVSTSHEHTSFKFDKLNDMPTAKYEFAGMQGEETDKLDDLVQPKPWEKSHAPKPPQKSQKSRIVIQLPEIGGGQSSDSDSEEPDKKKAKISKSEQKSKTKTSMLLSSLPPPVGAAGGKKSVVAFKPRVVGSKSKAVSSTTITSCNPSPKDAAEAARNSKAELIMANSSRQVEDEDAADDLPSLSTENFFNLNSSTENDDSEIFLPGLSASAPIYSAGDAPGPSTSTDTGSGYTPLPEPEEISVPPYGSESTSDRSGHEKSAHIEALSDFDLSALPREFVAELKCDPARLAEFQAQGGAIKDANADALLGNQDNIHRNLINNISAEMHANELRKKAKEGIQVTQLQRQRHQIHWLAQQAKEREIDLQLAWQKGQTGGQKGGSKYGFS